MVTILNSLDTERQEAQLNQSVRIFKSDTKPSQTFRTMKKLTTHLALKCCLLTQSDKFISQQYS